MGLAELTAEGADLLRQCGIEPVPSDWQRMTAGHDPRNDQKQHTAHVCLTARMARLHGYEVTLLPAEQPYFDLRLEKPDEVIYLECEARKKSRAARRERKWRRQVRAQSICAVSAKTPAAAAALEDEIYELGFDFMTTDLVSQLQDPPDFWTIDIEEF